MTLYSYRCEACGDAAAWRPSQQQVMCRACSTVVPLPAADATPAASFLLVPYLRNTPENRRTYTPERLERSCPTCNHLVVFEAAIEGTTCAACLTPLLRPPHASDMPIRPTGVVPFRIDEADARERLRTWWRDRRGSDPRTRHLSTGPLVMRYVPYWLFAVHVSCPWRHTTTDNEGRERVREGAVSGDYREREPGNHRVPADLLKQLPFAFDQAVAYDRRYLAGATVEQYDADMFEAWFPAYQRIVEQVNRQVNRAAGLFAEPEERWLNTSDETGCLILTPVYTTSVDFRGQRHDIVIDGHSGQIASTVPPHITLGQWLVVLGILAGLIALVWWAIVLVMA